MNRTTRFFACFVVLALLGAAREASAQCQPEGCPWCVTPTQCCLISESTDVSTCYVSGGRCHIIQGTCNVSDEDDLAAIAGEMQRRGLKVVDSKTLTVAGVERLFLEFTGGLLSSWNCQGTPYAVLRAQPGGRWIAYDPKEIGIDLNVQSVLAAVRGAKIVPTALVPVPVNKLKVER